MKHCAKLIKLCEKEDINGKFTFVSSGTFSEAKNCIYVGLIDSETQLKSSDKNSNKAGFVLERKQKIKTSVPSFSHFDVSHTNRRIAATSSRGMVYIWKRSQTSEEKAARAQQKQERAEEERRRKEKRDEKLRERQERRDMQNEEERQRWIENITRQMSIQNAAAVSIQKIVRGKVLVPNAIPQIRREYNARFIIRQFLIKIIHRRRQKKKKRRKSRKKNRNRGRSRTDRRTSSSTDRSKGKDQTARMKSTKQQKCTNENEEPISEFLLAKKQMFETLNEYSTMKKEYEALYDENWGGADANVITAKLDMLAAEEDEARRDNMNEKSYVELGDEDDDFSGDALHNRENDLIVAKGVDLIKNHEEFFMSKDSPDDTSKARLDDPLVTITTKADFDEENMKPSVNVNGNEENSRRNPKKEKMKDSQIPDASNNRPVGKSSLSSYGKEHKLDLHKLTSGINACSFSSDERSLVLACTDGFVRVLDVRTGEVTSTIRGHRGKVTTCLSCRTKLRSPETKKMARKRNIDQICSADSLGGIRLWKYDKDFDPLGDEDGGKRWKPDFQFSEHRDAIEKLVVTFFHMSHPLLTACDRSGLICCWCLKTMNLLAKVDFMTLTSTTARLTDISPIGSTGAEFVVCNGTKTSYVVDMTSQRCSGIIPTNDDNEVLALYCTCTIPGHSSDLLFGTSGLHKGKRIPFWVHEDTYSQLFHFQKITIGESKVGGTGDVSKYFLHHDDDLDSSASVASLAQSIIFCESPDATVIACVCIDGLLRIFDAKAPNHLLKVIRYDQSNEITSICFCASAKEKELLIATDEGSLVLVSLQKLLLPGSEAQEAEVILKNLVSDDDDNAYKGHEEGILCTSFSSNGSLLVSGGSDPHLIVWCTTARQRGENPLMTKLFVGEEHGWIKKSAIADLTINGETSYFIVAGSEYGHLFAWNICDPNLSVDTGSYVPSQICSLQAHADLITAICFSPDNLRVVTSSEDRSVKVWCFESSCSSDTTTTDSDSWELKPSHTHNLLTEQGGFQQPPVITCLCSFRDTFLLGGCNMGYVYVWSWKSYAMVSRYDAGQCGRPLSCITVSNCIPPPEKESDFTKLDDEKKKHPRNWTIANCGQEGIVLGRPHESIFL
eukprot:g2246.t1